MKHSFITRNLLGEEIVIIKAKGPWLWGKFGKKYLDFSSQTLNLNLGNSPNFLKKVILDQFDSFMFLSSRFENPKFIELSKMLIELAPKGLTKINIKLTNGSDANESAFKRVRVYHKKPYIVSFFGSHLGESCETISASGLYFPETKMGGSDRFLHIRPPFVYKQAGFSDAEAEEKTLNEIEVIFTLRKDIAAIILEPIMVNAGGYIFSTNFLTKLRKLTTKFNISLIFDEVQTAFGWLGSFFFSNRVGITPDLITLGKGLGAGLPLAGIIMRKEYDNIDYGLDEMTYGGHPLSCAVALASINYIRKNKLLEKIPEKEQLFQKSLKTLKQRHPRFIKETRLLGILSSVEFVSNFFALKVYNESLSSGLILRKSMDGLGSSLIMKPPIIIKKSEIRLAFEILDASIEKVIRNHEYS